MLEPLSIVASSIGLLTFVVNTFGGQLENINRRIMDYQGCKDALEGYKGILEEYEEHLRRWEIVWCREPQQPFDDETYDYLWGATGHEYMKNKAKVMIRQFGNINKTFCFRHASSANFDWESEELPEELRGKPGLWVQKYNEYLLQRSRPENPIIFRKFAFAIYKNAEIKNKLAVLKTSIEDLENSSARYFYQRHDIRVPNPPSSEDITHARDLYFQRNKFITLFNRIRRVHNEQLSSDDGYGWELVFAQTAPANVGMDIPTADCHLHDSKIEDAVQALVGRAHVVCSLYTENPDPDEYRFHSSTIKIHFPTDRPLLYDPESLAVRMIVWGERENVAVDVASRRSFAGDNAHWVAMRDGLRTGLDPRTHKPQTVFREFLQYYKLISTSAGIARSLVLFYGTSWLWDFCTCQILRAKPALSPLRELTTRWPLAQNWDKGIFDHCGHPEGGLRYRTFLILGVFLVEMAIVAPIEIVIIPNETHENQCLENGDVKFNLPPQVALPAGLQNPLTASELVLSLEQLKPRIGALHVGPNYTKAVQRCFEMRALFLRRRSGVFTAGDLDRCIQEIVKPLEVHCSALEVEYKKLLQYQWFQDAVQREDL